MSLTAALASQVAAAVRDRGKEYFRRGVVTLRTVSADDVIATVRGSSVYHVELTLAGRAVNASCTCPYIDEYRAACKHIWATLLFAEFRGFARTAAARGTLQLVVEGADGEDFPDPDDDYEEPLPLPPPRPAARPAIRPPAPRETWSDILAFVGRDARPAAADAGGFGRAADRQPVFVIDAPASAEARKVVLEVHAQDRKTNGEWGQPKAVRFPAESTTDPADRELLALLAGADRIDHYGYGQTDYGSGARRYRLTGPLLETVLPRLAATGRVRLRRDPNPPVVLEELSPDLDPPWVLTLTLTRDAGGRAWVLGGSLRRGDAVLAIAGLPLLVPGLVVWGHNFSRFDDGGAFVWVTTLRRAGGVVVPDREIDDFLARLLETPNLPRLDLPPELAFREDRVPPRPRLVVKPAVNVPGPPVLHAELSFDYDGVPVPAGAAGRGVFRADGRRFLVRDPAAEQLADRELTRLGVRPGWDRGQPTLELRPGQLPPLVRDLTAAGWRVEANGKLYRRAGGFELAVKSGRDWFDLTGAADFDGERVPFPRLLDAIRRGESTVLLDDGSVGTVPDEWLKKYGLFARMGTPEGDGVRFSRAQVGVLDALLAARPEVTFDAQFARARDQLAKFKGVAPADPPKGFTGHLREYQREGLGWLRFLRAFGFGGCLADDMGLGKTVQVLALLAGKRAGPALVVVPRSLVFNWKAEAAKFAPKLKVLDHTGGNRIRSGAEFAKHDIVITTYGTLRRDAEAFTKHRFDTCVLDESQAAKNADTDTARAVRLIQADHRLALSGTPVENHLGELWTLVDFLNPGMLGRTLPGADGVALRTPDAEMLQVLAKAVRPFILRRTKAEVAKDLPAKTEQTVWCDLGPDQRKVYDELRNHYRMSLLGRIDDVGLGRSKIQVLEALLRLRQASCHPGLIDKTRVGESSAKLDVLLPQLRELAAGGGKALVFSQFTSLLAIVRKRLDAEKITYEYLDGRTRDRAARVDRFQTDPACKLFLVSLKAGGVGLNLTAAEYVFLLDPWWNPAVEAQAIDRSHRIGQTKPVFAYRLIARGTVEEKVLELQQSKRALADAILGGDGRLIADLKREDLEMLLS